jgi:3-methyladenine DNA glycosylase AlkD
MITLKEAVATLQASGSTQKASEMASHHKVSRLYLGVQNAALDAAVKTWRADMTLDERLTLASDLWDSNIHEGRMAAAKLLVQARIKPDDAAWALITSWVPQTDTNAIAEQVCNAGSRRLLTNPSRIDELEGWTISDHAWTKRAALMMTLPWTKLNNPKPADFALRERVLGWAGDYTADQTWLIQTAVSGWLRELGRHDAPRVWAFLDAHGDNMKPSQRKDASRNLPPR